MKHVVTLILVSIATMDTVATAISTQHHDHCCPLEYLRISYHVTPCLGLQEEEPRTAYPMSLPWASYIADNDLTGR